MKPDGCKDCTERHVGCHSNCEKYQTYLDGLYLMREMIKKNKKKDREIDEYQITKSNKGRKKKRS